MVRCRNSAQACHHAASASSRPLVATGECYGDAHWGGRGADRREWYERPMCAALAVTLLACSVGGSHAQGDGSPAPPPPPSDGGGGGVPTWVWGIVAALIGIGIFVFIGYVHIPKCLVKVYPDDEVTLTAEETARVAAGGLPVVQPVGESTSTPVVGINDNTPRKPVMEGLTGAGAGAMGGSGQDDCVVEQFAPVAPPVPGPAPPMDDSPYMAGGGHRGVVANGAGGVSGGLVSALRSDVNDIEVVDETVGSSDRV